MKALRLYLEAAGITQAQFARRASINSMTLNHYLKGRRFPGRSNLRKISKASGISFERLLG